jgi:glucose/mannose transport system substrate-binding protein
MHAMKVFAAAFALAAWCATAVHAGELEVLHFWDVGNDARAAEVLKTTLRRQGHTWKDFAVASDGNGVPLFMLRSRVQSGNPPAAAMIKSPVIQQWAREGALANLDAAARAGQWDAVLPRVISDAMKYKGSYVAVPVNIHRLNWLWINTHILKRSNAQVPVTWDDFFAAADAMKRAGYVAVAHGGQPWQDFLLFESVALGVGGTEFYRKAFVALDPEALGGPVMAQVLQTFRRIKGYTDTAAMGLDWHVASARLANGEAGMQFMGDWARPVFQAAQQGGSLEFACVPAPGTAKAFAYSVDSFAMFRVNGPAKVKAQQDFAADLLEPALQEEFNLVKGSIPVREGVDLARFDRCAKQSAAAFDAAAHGGTLVPGVSMAMPPAVEDAMREAVSAYWHDDRVTARATLQRLVAAARRP